MEEVLKMPKALKVREIAANYIKNSQSRILELGPLNRCLLDRSKFKNYFFGDIRSTEEIKELYKGNEYLEKTGLKVDIDSVINIDFVIKSTYKETFKNIEKFDYVIVSHVLEHIPNLLFFFKDIQNVLKPDGELIILYPDRRFCFDALRTDTYFSDVYDVYINEGKNTARRVLDFFTNVLSENNPRNFWSTGTDILFNKVDRDYKKNLKLYKNTTLGQTEGDVHYWPFSDYAFLKFLLEAKNYELLPFSIKKFIPTQVNTQEFLIVLKYQEESPDSEFYRYMKDAVDHYSTAMQSSILSEKRELEVLLIEKDKLIVENNLIIKNIGENLKEVFALLQEERRKVYLLENSKSWQLTKPLRQITSVLVSFRENGIKNTIERIIRQVRK